MIAHRVFSFLMGFLFFFSLTEGIANVLQINANNNKKKIIFNESSTAVQYILRHRVMSMKYDLNRNSIFFRWWIRRVSQFLAQQIHQFLIDSIVLHSLYLDLRVLSFFFDVFENVKISTHRTPTMWQNKKKTQQIKTIYDKKKE